MTTTLSLPDQMTAPTVRSSDDHAGVLATTMAITRRTVLKFLRTPQLVVVGTIQGAMFLLIFRYVFGGAINAGRVSYVDFLVPGFVATGVLFSGMGAAAGVAASSRAMRPERNACIAVSLASGSGRIACFNGSDNRL